MKLQNPFPKKLDLSFENFERRLLKEYNMETEQTNTQEESRENLDIFDSSPFDIGLDNFEMDFSLSIGDNPFDTDFDF